MENRQTAVELLAIGIYSDCQFGETLGNRISIDKDYLEKIIDQAKQMEKEQLKDAYEDGDENGRLVEWGYERISSELFYNETYGK
jgi:hypothetical protein